MKKDKGLQKLTVSMKKVNEVLKLEKIFSEDLKGLTNSELDKVCAILTDQFNSAVGEQRDKIVAKFENFVPKSVKNELWESNHGKITYAISVINTRLWTNAFKS